MKKRFVFEVEAKDDTIYVNGHKFNRFKPENGYIDVSYAIAAYMRGLQFKFNGLYSKQVFWPEGVKFSVEYMMSKHSLVMPTDHYFQRAKELDLAPNTYLAMMHGEVIEAEFVEGKLEKIVTRLPHRYNKDKDICSAIVFNYEKQNDDEIRLTARVKTVWLNDKNDNHSTIDESKYVQYVHD